MAKNSLPAERKRKSKLSHAKIDVEALIENASEQLRHHLSASTKLAYETDWTRFCEFMAQIKQPSLPATPESLVLFVQYLLENDFSFNSMQRNLAAIRHYHFEANQLSPTDSGVVKRILKASARTLGRQVTQKKALLADDLMRLVDQIDINTLRGARDKAMLLLGFAGGFRRSEVVNLCYHDLTFIDHHLHIRLRKSKTDQEQRGLDKPIFGEINSIYCPVQAVKHWLSQSGIKSGHIFRRISKADRINLYKNQALSSVAYVNQLKHYAEQAGLDSSALAGHSLRSGFVTSAAMNGQDVLQIADITKQDIRTVQRYMRKAQQFEQHAGEGLLKSRKN